jgi:pimeloyl-ACP methyl ester carboxylesterase
VVFSKHVGFVGQLQESEDVQIYVQHSGDETKPNIVFVHGYPDTQAVWMPTIARLVDDFHCIAYDLRGFGRSTAPSEREGYRMPHLLADLEVAMGAFTGNDEPIHLVAHDWGSVQAWELVLRATTERRLRTRIASYTTISGPSVAHLGAWAARSRHGSWRQKRTLVRQMGHSWYVAAFQTPVLPELAMAGLLRLRHAPDELRPGARNGLNLYRANRHRPHEERTPLQTDVPVQLIVPTRDRFLIPELYEDLPLWCSDLTRHDIDAGHWVMREQPDQLATWIAEHVRAHDSSATRP